MKKFNLFSVKSHKWHKHAHFESIIMLVVNKLFNCYDNNCYDFIIKYLRTIERANEPNNRLLCDKLGEFVDKSRDMFMFTFYISCNLKRNELFVHTSSDRSQA